MSNMNYISFSVDGQKLSCDQKYYSSTGTINTLFCSFKFKTNDSENTSGWDLPYLWTQFHDKNGNTYVKPVNENTCAIPSGCLRQPEFKMTLFATDTENYIVCTKRYTTNEVTFRFNGDANLDYDGGVNPDDPIMPSNWQILVGKVAEYENRVDGLSQNVSKMGGRVDELGVNLENESTVRARTDFALESALHVIETTCWETTKPLRGTGAGFHSSIYRGKYLGNTYTDEQKETIADGSFDDLFIGDYWTINGVNWRIADFDYYYNIGNTNFTKHHVVIVPDTILYNAQMNSTNTTAGCYSGSEMYTTNLNDARIMFDNAFGSQFIPTHRGMYSNATSGNNPSGWTWRDMRIELMSEEQVYGHAIWGVGSQNGYDVGTQKTQFKLFALDQTKINTRQAYWLTNVRSSTTFSHITYSGYAEYDVASSSYGVRPFACLVGE